MTPATQENRQKVFRRLKARARKVGQYLANRQAHLDCGQALADEVAGTGPESREFDHLMGRLRRIDPDFPDTQRR